MKQRINIIVTCTKRKRLPPSPELMLRNIKADDMSEGFATWVERLSASKSKTLTARELYAGDHWSVVKTLERIASSSGLDALVWVCSAGYGLISLDSKIKSYSATFSPNNEDSVCKWLNSDSNRNPDRSWWRLHTEWTGTNESQPRSINDVAEQCPDSPMLVVASKPYMGAILDDVKMASKTLYNRESLCIISAGTKFLPDLEFNLLPCNGSLQSEEGGSLNSLNPRLARTILSNLGSKTFKVSNLKAEYNAKIATTHLVMRKNRKILANTEVRDYILAALKENPRISWSRTLGELRDSGRSCSQERFVSVFKQLNRRVPDVITSGDRA